MGELITTLVTFIDETLLYWIPALVVVGYAVKHCTRFPNQLIPLVEVGVGSFLGVAYGVALSMEVGGFDGGFLAVIKYAGQGALLGLVAMALYDMIHGVIQQRKAMKEEEKNEKA